MGYLNWMGESGVGCGWIIITVYGGYIQCNNVVVVQSICSA